jgi:hypothetical protein
MKIMKRPAAAFVSILVIFVLISCVSTSEVRKEKYGVLESAVTFSADKVIGEYGDSIPDDFSGATFMAFIKGNIPDSYYEALTEYQVAVKPMGSYYLLLVYDQVTYSLILFDYSCTPEVDGPVLFEPGKYDINHLELYDKCREGNY